MTEKQISVLAALLAASVDYAVVGGIAVNAHGYVRATNDLDIFIRPTEENAHAVHDALLAAGAPLEGITAVDFLDDEQNVRRNRVEAHVHGLVIPFISKADLIANKRQVGPLRDLADVEELELDSGRVRNQVR